MAEVSFYHLERARLEDALPKLLEKALERGLRCVVQGTDEERLAHLDAHLWTYDEAGFLPHGRAGGGDEEAQPVLLTDEDAASPNGAEVLFAVDGARPEAWDAWARTCILFDGRDDDALKRARTWWREAKEAGASVTYWRQSPEGRWEKKA